ncbi:MAG: hypothetical protein AAFY03_03535, partial [Pseudomonadota bacterium]
GGAMIPLVHRGRLSAHATSLGGVDLNVWDSELWNIADWYRIKTNGRFPLARRPDRRANSPPPSRAGGNHQGGRCSHSPPDD